MIKIDVRKPKILMLIALFSIMANYSIGQSISSYSYGVLGNIGDGYAYYSGPVNIDGSSCVFISNGVRTMQEKSINSFINYCEVLFSNYDLIQFTASPNPISTYTILKLKEPLMIDIDEKILMQIYKVNGALVSSTTVTLSQLNSGYLMQIDNMLSSGIYFIKATSANKLFKPITILK